MIVAGALLMFAGILLTLGLFFDPLFVKIFCWLVIAVPLMWTGGAFIYTAVEEYREDRIVDNE